MKLLVIFGLVVALSVSGLGFVITSFVEKTVNKTILDISLRNARSRADYFSSWVKARIDEIEGLAAIPIVAERREPDVFETLSAFRSTKAAIYDLLFYGGTDGIAHTTTGAAPDISNRSYYVAMQGGTDIAISEPIISRATFMPVFVVARAIRKDGEFYGFAAGSIELTTITAAAEVLTLTEAGKGEFGFILTSEGIPIAFPDEKIRMNVSFTKDKELSSEEVRAAFSAWEPLKPVAGKMVAGENSYEYFTKDGTNYICFFAPIEHSPGWSLGIVVPAKTIMGTGDRIRFLTSLGVIVAVILALAITALVSKLITNQIVKTEERLLELAEGEARLTARLPVKSRDEVGKLAAAFNKFLSKLESIVLNIREAVIENEAIGDSLAAGVEEISSTLNELASNIESIRKNLIAVSKEVETISSDASETHERTKEIDALIDSLTESFTNSSTAIEQMLANIKNISAITENKVQLVSKLRDLGGVGNIEIAETINLIKELSASVNSIKDMVKVINSISGQTNLLAMNAAIEAAHAGDAGAGFSVVAEEIRNLAEDTNIRAKSISQSINEMIAKINAASERGSKTASAFAEILQGIDDVHKAFDETSTGIRELATGSSQVAEGISSVATLTNKIHANSDTVRTNAEHVDLSLEKLNTATMESKQAIEETAIGVREIANTMNELVNLGQRNKTNIHKVESTIGRFSLQGTSEESEAGSNGTTP